MLFMLNSVSTVSKLYIQVYVFAQMILSLYVSGTNFGHCIGLNIDNLLVLVDFSLLHAVLSFFILFLLCMLANYKGNLPNFQMGHY